MAASIGRRLGVLTRRGVCSPPPSTTLICCFPPLSPSSIVIESTSSSSSSRWLAPRHTATGGRGVSTPSTAPVSVSASTASSAAWSMAVPAVAATSSPTQPTQSTSPWTNPSSSSSSSSAHVYGNGNGNSNGSGDWSNGVMNAIENSGSSAQALQTFSAYRQRLSTSNVLATLAYVSRDWPRSASPGDHIYNTLISSGLIDEVVHRLTVTAIGAPSGIILTNTINAIAKLGLVGDQLLVIVPLLRMIQKFVRAAHDGTVSDHSLLFKFRATKSARRWWTKLFGSKSPPSSSSSSSSMESSKMEPDEDVRWSADEILSLMNAMTIIRSTATSTISTSTTAAAGAERGGGGASGASGGLRGMEANREIEDILSTLDAPLLDMARYELDKWHAPQLAALFHVAPALTKVTTFDDALIPCHEYCMLSCWHAGI
jgi:hypothetical protein